MDGPKKIKLTRYMKSVLTKCVLEKVEYKEKQIIEQLMQNAPVIKQYRCYFLSLRKGEKVITEMAEICELGFTRLDRFY